MRKRQVLRIVLSIHRYDDIIELTRLLFMILWDGEKHGGQKRLFCTKISYRN